MFDIFTKEGLMSFLYTLPILLFSLSIHEFSHAFVAYKLGDKSQKAYGRLTLDPFKHIDIFSLICIALVGFGWGKPVIVDDRNFKDKSKGNMFVALAGPLSNLLIAILLTLLFKVLIFFGLIEPFSQLSMSGIISNMIILSIQFNVVFFVFNMIPIPPFDGSRVLRYFLPLKLKEKYDILENYSFFIVLFLVITKIAGYIVAPISNFIFKLLGLIL